MSLKGFGSLGNSKVVSHKIISDGSGKLFKGFGGGKNPSTGASFKSGTKSAQNATNGNGKSGPYGQSTLDGAQC